MSDNETPEKLKDVAVFMKAIEGYTKEADKVLELIERLKNIESHGSTYEELRETLITLRDKLSELSLATIAIPSGLGLSGKAKRMFIALAGQIAITVDGINELLAKDLYELITRTSIEEKVKIASGELNMTKHFASRAIAVTRLNMLMPFLYAFNEVLKLITSSFKEVVGEKLKGVTNSNS